MGESGVRPQAGVPLAPYTTLGVGGEARWFLRAGGAGDVAGAHRWSTRRGVPLIVLGAGSNVVVADGVVSGLVVQMAALGLDIAPDGDGCVVEAGAGTPWTDVVDAVVARGLAGVECLAGIPGSVGGTPIQNIGAYGQEVAGVVDRVVTFDRGEGRVVEMPAEACGFGYRTSRFRTGDAGRFIVCAVRYRLRSGPPTLVYPDLVRYLDEAGDAAPTVADVRKAVLTIRRRKGMVLDAADPDTRSVGSFFVNPVVSGDEHARLRAGCGDVPAVSQPDGRVKIPAAWLIEQSGFARGFRAGPVGLSTKHSLAIVTRDGATADAVVGLAVAVKRRVAERFGMWLRPEPVFVGFGEHEGVAYLRRERP